jgi:beta-lactamase class A
MQQSDNTAAHVLGVRIGTDVIQNMLSVWKMNSTDMENNKTTAQDMSILFQKIYNGEIANPALTHELLGFMTNTDFEDRIPKDLPKGIKVFHKAGDGDGFVHDVGVVEYENGKAYYLGIMTSDIGDTQDKTKQTIGEISKKIYDTLSR